MRGVLQAQALPAPEESLVRVTLGTNPSVASRSGYMGIVVPLVNHQRRWGDINDGKPQVAGLPNHPVVPPGSANREGRDPPQAVDTEHEKVNPPNAARDSLISDASAEFLFAAVVERHEFLIDMDVPTSPYNKEKPLHR